MKDKVVSPSSALVQLFIEVAGAFTSSFTQGTMAVDIEDVGWKVLVCLAYTTTKGLYPVTAATQDDVYDSTLGVKTIIVVTPSHHRMLAIVSFTSTRLTT